jgi:hypothetical protein
MLRLVLVIAFAPCFAGLESRSVADEQTPTIPRAAKAPEDALAIANKKASDAKSHAIEIAVRNYVIELKAALNSAMQTGNLDEANRIKTETERTNRGDPSSGSEVPKGAAAIAARRRFDHAVDKGNGQFRTSNEAALRKCVSDLEFAIKQALKAGALDEANQIKAEIERIKSSSTPAVQAGPGRDELLELVNTDKDAVGGTVVKNGSSFTVSGNGRLIIPYSPKGDYALYVKAMRTAGSNDIIVCFPVGEATVTLILSGWGGSGSGLEMVNQMSYNKNKTTVTPGKLTNGKWYEILIAVARKGEKVEIVVQLDHAEYIRWNGKDSELSPVGDVPERVKREKVFMVGSAHDAVNVFASVKVVERPR